MAHQMRWHRPSRGQITEQNKAYDDFGRGKLTKDADAILAADKKEKAEARKKAKLAARAEQVVPPIEIDAGIPGHPTYVKSEAIVHPWSPGDSVPGHAE